MKNQIQTGWLSPNGEMVVCDTFYHIQTAIELCEDLYDDVPEGKTCDDYLIDRGWVHITFSILANAYMFIWNFFGSGLTYEQKEYMRSFFEDQQARELIDEFSLYSWDSEMKREEGLYD